MGATPQQPVQVCVSRQLDAVVQVRTVVRAQPGHRTGRTGRQHQTVSGTGQKQDGELQSLHVGHIGVVTGGVHQSPGREHGANVVHAPKRPLPEQFGDAVVGVPVEVGMSMGGSIEKEHPATHRRIAPLTVSQRRRPHRQVGQPRREPGTTVGKHRGEAQRLQLGPRPQALEAG